jgi:hypothetical protein
MGLVPFVTSLVMTSGFGDQFLKNSIFDHEQ